MKFKIDSFWEAFNASRCKTAMLLISIIIALAFAGSQLLQVESQELNAAIIIIIGYWAGRTSKAKEK